MEVFDLASEERFDSARHVEKVLGRIEGGDYSVACWEPGQTSPYHCHPDATEIYFCVSGGGVMRTPERTVDVKPGGFVAHPPGELHEFENGPARSVLFRVRYGRDMSSRAMSWDKNADWHERPEDRAYFEALKIV
jgi:quercetin dioxygenase-like cupin family protein